MVYGKKGAIVKAFYWLLGFKSAQKGSIITLISLFVFKIQLSRTKSILANSPKVSRFSQLVVCVGMNCVLKLEVAVLQLGLYQDVRVHWYVNEQDSFV